MIVTIIVIFFSVFIIKACATIYKSQNQTIDDFINRTFINSSSRIVFIDESNILVASLSESDSYKYIFKDGIVLFDVLDEEHSIVTMTTDKIFYVNVNVLYLSKEVIYE